VRPRDSKKLPTPACGGNETISTVADSPQSQITTRGSRSSRGAVAGVIEYLLTQ
jgi:hypothetical protein